MKNLKLEITLAGVKSLYWLIRRLNLGEGTSFIGALVNKYNPSFLKSAVEYITKEKIAVTGTNGKTTTSGLITHILRENARNVIANSKGANMLSGIINEFAISLDTKKEFSNCVIEADEAYLAQIQKVVKADYLLVTNLFRDQLDRYGEIDITRKKIQAGIDVNTDVILVLNADDPMVANLKSKKTPIYYGVKSVIDNTDSSFVTTSDELLVCNCGGKLTYDKKFYAHQGHYRCECGYSRPIPDFEAEIVLEKDFSLIRLGEEEFRVPLVGLFNAYNALAAIALLKSLGVQDIKEHLATFKTAFGRSEVRKIRGHKSIVQLIKNPAGANQVIGSVDLNSNIMIAINDNYADGRDVSWLWDASFEQFNLVDKKIIVSGIRAYDMAVRLKYAGVSLDKIVVIPDIKKALDYLTKIADNDITILSSYTALLELNKLWKKF